MAAKTGKMLLKISTRNIEMVIANTYIKYKSKQHHIMACRGSAGLDCCLIFTGLSVVGEQSSGDEEEMYDAK